MSGVTTARALGDGTGFVDVILRDAIERGEAVGPRLLVAAQALRPSHGTSPEAAVVADGVDEVRRCVRQAIFHGADVIKLFISNISRGSSHIDYLKGDLTQVSAYSKEELVAAVEEARRSGVKVCGHCIGGDVVRWALEAGFASLEHANLIEEDIPLFLKTGAYISDPNLILFFDPVRGFETPTNKTHKWEDLPEWWHEKVRRSREQTRRVMSKALKAGVKFALGTDLNHTLLWLECKYFIEEIGATNMQALFAVTRDSAELLGLADEIGTLEEGKCADIICVDGNPLEDISALSRVQMVMRSGHVVKDTLALIIIVVEVAHLVVGDQAATVPAVSVVLPTSLAQGQSAFSIVIFAPDTLPAAVTQDCAAVPAGGTQVPAVKAAVIRQRMLLVTELADKGFAHRTAPPTKSSMGAKCSAYRSICSSVRLSKCSDSGGAPHRKKGPAITS